MSGPASQRGVALLLAMLVVAVVTATAVSAFTQQQAAIATATTSNRIFIAESTHRAAESLAVAALLDDASEADYDGGDEDWLLRPVEVDRETTRVTATMEDLNGLFNLNNLVPSAAGSGPGGQGALNPNGPAGTGSSAGAETSPPTDLDGNSSGPDSQGANSADQAPPVNRIPPPNEARRQAVCPPGVQFNDTDCLVYEVDLMDGRVFNVVNAPAAVLAQSGLNPEAFASLSSDQLQQVVSSLSQSIESGAPSAPVNLPNANSDAEDSAVAGQQALPDHEVALARFERLLTLLNVDDSFVQALLDWVDADNETRYPNGAEDDYYLDQDPPYRTANGPLRDVSELLLVRNMTMETYNALKPFLVALPGATDINVNTAPVEVIASISPLLDTASAQTIADARDVQPFLSVSEFSAHPMIQGRQVSTQRVGVQSRFARMQARVTQGPNAWRITSLLSREPDRTVRVLQRVRSWDDDG